ncbi:histone-like nucleoid-structuring protein Lsr2 [Streptomyces sp. NPDC058872]|uniref:Lsr2 family DNA-binding protein n=1 Tax=Streptomyces sp. NPDC058872 TaxID=3346661 RepID=UPI003693BD6C
MREARGDHTRHARWATRAIRRWANAHGYDLPERGRIPIEIIEAWKRKDSG